MNRKELYALVWSTPMTHAAKRFGISDVALRKTCVRHDIPVPPLGYWAKVAHGKKVVKPPLPSRSPSQIDHIYLQYRTAPHVPDIVAKASDEVRRREEREDARILVPKERPERLHAIALGVERTLRKASPDSEGFISTSGPGLPTVTIGPGSAPRATILVDTLLKGLITRGYRVAEAEQGAHLIVEEEIFKLFISETRDRRPHVPTAAELKAQVAREELRRRYPTIYSTESKAYRTWDYFPSGRLSFELRAPTSRSWQDKTAGRWYDRTTKEVEAYLNDAIAKMVVAAAEIKFERAEAAERARIAAEEAKRREREAAVREQASKRQKFLVDLAEAFADYNRMAALLHHLESMISVRAEAGDPALRLVQELRSRVEGDANRFGLDALEVAASSLYPDED